jgi:hypothetical protein
MREVKVLMRCRELEIGFPLLHILHPGKKIHAQVCIIVPGVANSYPDLILHPGKKIHAQVCIFVPGFANSYPDLILHPGKKIHAQV